MDRWDELNPADFAKLSAQLLYEMVGGRGGDLSSQHHTTFKC